MQARQVHNAVKIFSVLLAATSVSACFSLKSYEPQTLEDGRPAVINGDYHLRAGAVVNVFLRSVDDQPLHFWQHAANVDAGQHRLLVDCEVTATDKISRHELNVSVESGVRYRLSAEANDQQGCTQVNLDELE
ncbi:MAG: hypothetical protein QM808_17425 [Steroidobacteraceae bacterium]